MSGRRGSGSFGSGRTAGYAIGEGRTSPWLEAIAGIRERPYPRLGSKPVPAPRTRPEVRCGLRHGFHRRCPRLKQAPLPSAKKGWGKPLPSQKVCAGQSSVQARCAGQFFKLVVLSVGRSTLSYVVGSTVPVLAAERLHNERFNECQGAANAGGPNLRTHYLSLSVSPRSAKTTRPV